MLLSVGNHCEETVDCRGRVEASKRVKTRKKVESREERRVWRSVAAEKIGLLSRSERLC